MDWLGALREEEDLRRLAAHVTADSGPITLHGLWGSALYLLPGLLAERTGRLLLLIVADPEQAEDARDDLAAALRHGTGEAGDGADLDRAGLTGAGAVELLPALDRPVRDLEDDDELAAERLRICLRLADAARAGGQAHGAAKGAGAPGGEVASEAAAGGGANLPQVVVAPIQALMQPAPSAEAIRRAARGVRVGERLDLEELIGWLGSSYRASDQVEAPGDFARRGGIVDVFPDGFLNPVRIELFGDEIESIRYFDAGTQRSNVAVQEVQIPGRGAAVAALRGDRRAAAGDSGGADSTGFTALLPPDAIVAIVEPAEVQEIGRSLWQRTGERVGLIPPERVLGRVSDFATLYVQRFASGDADAVHFPAGSLPQFEAKTADALEALDELARTGTVYVLCESAAERRQVEELLAESIESRGRRADGDGRFEHGRGGHFQPGAAEPHAQPGAAEPDGGGGSAAPALVEGALSRGFRWRDVAYVPHHELFHRFRKRRTLRKVQAARPIDSFFDLNAGDYVVHVSHGIGRFRGLKTIERDGRPHAQPRAAVPHAQPGAAVPQAQPGAAEPHAQPGAAVPHAQPGAAVPQAQPGAAVPQAAEGGRGRAEARGGVADEYLVIEFADHAVVHVPASQIHLVQKYIGSREGRPRLSKLGGATWKRAKQRAADAVSDMAGELLAIQARRATEEGISYPADTHWQAEFEAAFPFTETEDQLRAMEEIKRDMIRVRPMDRLVCGDVGFGKTELAIRAAFKVIEYGKQVAVLVPTTVLAEQHYKTFTTRMADYPFVVEALSRFRSKGEQARIIERARKGQIDVLVGTHRLLSGDVRFADLGLVIIDEEQRFGVEAKEKLKRLRSTVDVLTLSATPIPRTLHLSLLGIRDISSLGTPPVDRRAIVSQVRGWDDRQIEEAIRRELDRGGQVYFVHNFVRDIDQVANKVRSLVPEATVVVGHGQMAPGELEEVMLQFVRGSAQILVSTNIIESGLDIPSANTIFINRAERFGLADLHQLRGRVGRSHVRAYCYLLLSPRHPPTEQAAKRLKAIEHYSDLGAGFQIAMRDLEIRGAGNILGAEQSGHIEAVGYEMYCQLLEQAVRRMKNEPADAWRAVNLDLGVSASIPRRYIRSERQRMEVYKRLAAARRVDDVQQLRADLRDAFGALPPEVETLVALAEVRVLAQPWGIRSIVLDPPDVVFAVEDFQRVQALLAEGPGSPRLPDPRTIHWRLPKRLLTPERLIGVLREQLARSPQACVAASG